MAQPFETNHEASVAVTPEQVWDAITDGPKIDSWFMGRNEVEPREGGTLRFTSPGFTAESTITAWEPPTRFEFTSDVAPDGTFHVFEYLVDRRPDGDSTVRWNHRGALGGDWQAEYEAMREGDPMYFAKLAEYLTYFLGRHATSIEVLGPRYEDGEFTWEAYRAPLGIAGLPTPGVGDRVRLEPDSLDPIDGVVDALSTHFFGVRTGDAMYRFICGFEGSTMVGHHLFADDVDRREAEAAWSGWLTRSFA